MWFATRIGHTSESGQKIKWLESIWLYFPVTLFQLIFCNQQSWWSSWSRSDKDQGNFDVSPMLRQLGLFWEFWLTLRMILMFLIQIRIEAILMSAQCQDNCDNEDYFDLQFGGMLMISIQIRIKAILMSVQCHAGVKSISRWQTDLPLNLSMAYLHLPTVMVSYPLQPINVGMGDPSEP